jgi:hypothetical protein
MIVHLQKLNRWFNKKLLKYGRDQKNEKELPYINTEHDSIGNSSDVLMFSHALSDNRDVHEGYIQAPDAHDEECSSGSSYSYRIHHAESKSGSSGHALKKKEAGI